MAAVLRPENRIFQNLTEFLHPFIISMTYDGNSNVMKKAFFEILVHLNFSMKYEVSIEVVFLHHFIISIVTTGVCVRRAVPSTASSVCIIRR